MGNLYAATPGQSQTMSLYIYKLYYHYISHIMWETQITNPSFGNGLYHPFMEILGMVHYRVYGGLIH